MNTIISWCPDQGCDPCKPPTEPPTPTTPGGGYVAINQTVWPDYFGGPSVIIATVNVGPNGYISGPFNLDNPYPGKTMLYMDYARNIAYPNSIGYLLGQFATPELALAAANAAIANMH